MECPHLLDHINSNSTEIIANVASAKRFECSDVSAILTRGRVLNDPEVCFERKICGKKCAVSEENWLCLQCGIVSCGRYIHGHAKYHSERFHHQLCMSCDVYSVYCYECDEYVSNDSIDHNIEKIRKHVINKRNESNCSNQNEIINGKIKPIKKKNSVTSEYCDISSESCLDYDSKSNLQNATMEPKNKAKVSKKSVKSIRNMQQKRSRKRSHSKVESEDNPQSKRNEENMPQVDGRNTECKIVGLKNLGNTCFMNAVLQSLNNIQEFSCYFSQLPSLEVKTNGKKVYHSRSYTRQHRHDVIMAEELRKVLINLNNGGCGSKGAISPECLFLVIWKVVPRFRGYQQQDAHEFLRYMLDRLHTELLQFLPSETAVGTLVPRVRSTIVTTVFGGTLQSEVRCLACGTESKKDDPFLDLSLELPESRRHGDPVLLTDCLSSFVQVEELADTERYFCSRCKSKQKSTKQFWIRRLPNVLCLHLKRFRWHNYFRTKVDTAIKFPLSALDMSRYLLANIPDTRRSGHGNNLYDLAAVIVHHGSGAGSGHYTAFAIKKEQWFHFNDKSVRPANVHSVSLCKPYIMFYIRRKIPLPTAS